MMKRLFGTLLLLIGLAAPAAAQLGTVPYTFSPGTTIKSAEVNTNFSTAYSTACLRSACVLTGTITTRSLLPAATATYDIGLTGTRYRDAWFSRNVTVGGDFNVTSGDATFADNVTIGVLHTDFGAADDGASGLDVANGGTGLQIILDGRIPFGNDQDPMGTDANLTWDSASKTLVVAGVNAAQGAFSVAGGNNAGAGIFGLKVSCACSGSPAAGYIDLQDLNGVNNFIWVDASGNVRVGASVSPAAGAGDVVGTVVGTQTSTRDTKDITGRTLVRPQDALGAILSAPVYDFTYKSGAYSGTRFHGLVIDDSPWIGMDPSPTHPAGRSFNPETSLGYTVLAIKALEEEIAQLREQVAQLRAEVNHAK